MNQLPLAGQRLASANSSNLGMLEVAIAIARKKRAIVIATIAVALVSAVVSFLLPNVYKATAKLLPPQQAQSGTAAVLSQLTGAAGLAAGMTGIKNPSDVYVAMLKSRTVADRLIAKFNLKDLYDTDSSQKAREKLESATNISSGKDGLITIEVESKDQKLVAKITNGYIEELMKLTSVLAVTEASQRRLFFEKQLESAKNNLANAEISLKKALDTRGVISVDADSRAIVETVGRLRAQISAKEIELNAKSAFVTPTNPEYQRTEKELASLRAELSRLENGRSNQNAPTANSQTGLENIKILRDVKYYQMLYELLAKQYEVARLDEAKDSSLIQVLDQAVAPEKKSKPFRALIVLAATVFGFFCAIGIVILSENKRSMLNEPEFALRWNELVSLIRRKKS